MPAAQQHRIRKAVFEFRFPDEATAFHVRQRLEDLFTAAILPALEEVFDAAAPDDRVYRLERLEIDLGVIPPQRLDADFIRQALRARLPGLWQRRGSSEVEVSLPSVSLADALCHFLESGEWPWHSLLHHLDEAERAVRQLEAPAARRLAQRVHALLERPQARFRLIHQFSEALAPWLIRQLWPEWDEDAWRLALAGIGEIDSMAAQDLLLRHIAEMSPTSAIPSAVLAERLRASAASPRGEPGLLSSPLPPSAASLPEPSSRGGTQSRESVAPGNRMPGFPPEAAIAPERPVSQDLSLYVRHAGVVLLHPFLERFFQRLGLLDADRQFVSPACQAEAAHLLHFLVAGTEHPPEPETLLFKVLCGLPLRSPLVRRLPFAEEAKEEGRNLLAAVIRHWRKLQDTSPAGLREAFLQREGKLTGTPDGWHLVVAGRGVDVLLAYLPWSLSRVHLPWMALPLRVDWA